jgi:hypothetical protein
VTRQQVRRTGYLEEFLRFWQANVDTRMIWVSLYTPQRGELSAERLTATDRQLVIDDLRRLRSSISKLEMFDGAPGSVRPAARFSVGMHLCANDGVFVRRPRATDHAMSVWR